jgi:GNAT superfamily N-acetyltransferase
MDDEEVTLPDGARILVRPVRPEDKGLFTQAWERFGADSRYLRFLGPKKGLSSKELAYLTEVDHANHEALGARDAETGEGVGVARFVRLEDDPGAAEAAVAVVDDWQHRGVGRALLERLTERARENGIQRFRAELFAFNRSMIALFDDVGDVRARREGEGRMELDVELSTSRRSSLLDTLRAAASGHIRLRP